MSWHLWHQSTPVPTYYFFVYAWSWISMHVDLVPQSRTWVAFWVTIFLTIFLGSHPDIPIFNISFISILTFFSKKSAKILEDFLYVLLIYFIVFQLTNRLYSPPWIIQKKWQNNIYFTKMFVCTQWVLQTILAHSQKPVQHQFIKSVKFDVYAVIH